MLLIEFPKVLSISLAEYAERVRHVVYIYLPSMGNSRFLKGVHVPLALFTFRISLSRVYSSGVFVRFL